MRRVVLITVAAIAFGGAAGCGSSDSPSVDTVADQRARAAEERRERQRERERRRAEREARRQEAYAACTATLGDLRDELQELDSRLSVGLNYENYTTAVADAHVAYDRMTITDIVQYPGCLGGVGGKLEKALNQYTSAAKAWNECFADWDCTNDAVKPKLQQHWSKASLLLLEARLKLESLAPR